MDCSVIYYAARKTSFCEKALNRCLVIGKLLGVKLPHFISQHSLASALRGVQTVCFVVVKAEPVILVDNDKVNNSLNGEKLVADLRYKTLVL